MIALRTLERILSIMKNSYPLITKLLLFLSIFRIPSNIFFLPFEMIFRSTWFLIINCSIKYLRYSWNNIFHIYENTKINEVFSKLSHHSEEISTEKFLQFFSSHFTFHPDSSITFKLNYARYITDNQTKRYSQRFDNTLNSLSTYNSPRAIYLPSVSGARTFGVGQEGKDESSSKARHWKRTKGSELSRQKRENNRTRFVDGASRDNDNGGRKGAVPRMSPQPSIVPLLVVLVPLKDTVSQDAVEDKRATLSRARIVHGLAARIFQESILYLPTLDSSKHPLPLGGRKPSHVADSSVIGEKSRPICWRDVLNDPWNCFYQSVRILTIFTAISPSFFYVRVFVTRVFERIVRYGPGFQRKEERRRILDYFFRENCFGFKGLV